MSTILAFISLAFLALSTFLSEGSIRYFEVSSKAGTAPFTITLNASDLDKAKQAEKFIWDFGNGESLTTTNPIIQYTYQSGGAFTLKLRYLKKAKDNISKAKDGGSVKIAVSPKPNTLPVPQLSCISNEINKLECDSVGSTDSDGTIASYQFDWGDNTTNDFTSVGVVSHQYQSAGEKTVRLTVTDNKNGTAFIEKSFILKANTAPLANFLCRKTGIQKIHCESTSNDNEEILSNFTWTLDDGSTYSTASFDHTFSRPLDVAISVHNISLKVTDNLGLDSTIAKNIEVDLEAVREAPRGYFKAFIDGTSVDLRAFIIKTQFNIKRASYQIYDAQNNLIHTLPINDFYQNNSTKINLENFGNYRVTLTIVDYRDQQIVVTRQVPLVEDTSTLSPFVSFRAIQSNIRTLYLNLNQSFDYDENYSIREFVVDLGNGQTRTLTTDTFLTYIFPTAGTYTISVTAKTNHGTGRTFSQPITITDSEVAPVKPDPTFAYRIYSFAQNVTFYNEKSGTPNGEIISYHWDFGDNTEATGESQAHFYMPGEYLVKLTVVDTAGYSSTQTQKIAILAEGADVVANIDCNQRPPYLDITQMCKVNALDKFNEINRIRVVWGDGAVFTLATPFDPRQGIYYPQKAYTAEGTYPVRLIVNTSRGAFKTHDISHTVTARRPVANIQCYTNNLLVSCNSLGSYDPTGSLLTYTFDYGDSFTETNVNGISSHAYSSAGLHTVKLKLRNAYGVETTTQTQVQTLQSPNQLPYPILGCYSNLPFILRCSSNYSQDSDGEIVSYKYSWDDNTSDVYASGEEIFHVFNDGGSHQVTLTVTDNDGGVNSVTNSFTLRDNYPPVASMSCQTSENKITCNALSSYDVDGQIMLIQWDMGDGTIARGNFVEHVYQGLGQFEVKLFVTDNSFLTSEVSQIFPIFEFSPVPLASCQLNGLNLSCDGSSSFAPGGTISSYRWLISGEPDQMGAIINYNFRSEGVKEVSLEVTNNNNRVARKIIGTFTIVSSPPVANFICAKIRNSTLTCNGSVSQGGSWAIQSYIWTVNGSTYQGQKQNFSFTEDGDYLIKLTVVNELGTSSSFESIFEMEPSTDPILSSGKIVLAEESVKFFYPTQTQLKFFAIETSLKEDFTQNSILLNGAPIDEKNINYNLDTNSIMLDVSLLDGKNEIEINVFDTAGKMVQWETIIWSGSRIVQIDIKDEGNNLLNGGKVEISPMNDPQVKLIKESLSGRVTLENVPALDFMVAATSSNTSGNKIIFKENTSEAIILRRTGSVIDNENNNFENGINGWTIQDADHALVDGKLELRPGPSGVATLRRSLKATDATAKAVSFSFSISSPNIDDFYSITMKNSATGAMLHEFSSTKEISEAFNNDGSALELVKSIPINSINDIVEVELKLYSKNMNESVVQSSVWSEWLIPSASAAVGPTIEARIRGLSFQSGIGILSVGLFDAYSLILQRDLEGPKILRHNVSDYRLRYLSVGKFPDYRGGNVPGELITKNDIYAILNLNGDPALIENARLIVKLSDNSTKIVEQSATEIANGRIFLKEGNNYAFHFKIPSNPLVTYKSLADSKILNIYLEYAVDGKIIVRPINGAEGSFKPLVSLSAYIGGIKDVRFSKRDEDLGGDDWTRPEFVDFLNYNVINPDTRAGSSFDYTKFNDFSKMNGGPHPDHKSHESGNIYDGRFEGFKLGNVNKYDRNGKLIKPLDPIKDLKIAERLLFDLERASFEENVEKILVTYLPEGNFIKKLQTRCLANGRMAAKTKGKTELGVVRYKDSHADHFHVELKFDRKKIGRSSPPEEGFSSERGAKYGLLKFKNNETGEFIKTEDYIIMGEATIDSGNPVDVENYIAQRSLVRLQPVGTDTFAFFKDDKFIVPLSENSGNFLKYKVVYTGNTSKGCYESELYSADISPKLEISFGEDVEMSPDGKSIFLDGFSNYNRKIYVQAKDLYDYDNNTEVTIKYWDYVKDVNGKFYKSEKNLVNSEAEIPVPFSGSHYLTVTATNISGGSAEVTKELVVNANQSPKLLSAYATCTNDLGAGSITLSERTSWLLTNLFIEDDNSVQVFVDGEYHGGVNPLNFLSNSPFKIYHNSFDSFFELKPTRIFRLQDTEGLYQSYILNNPCKGGVQVAPPGSIGLPITFTILFGQ